MKLDAVNIVGDRVLIRSFSLKDVDVYYRDLTSDIYEKTGDSVPEKFDKKFARRIIKMSLERLNKNKSLILGIFSKETGDFIGGVNAFDFDFEVGKVEVGYWILKKERRKGYLNEALRIFCAYLFNVLRLKRIYADGVFESNAASYLALEKVGFKREAVRRKNSIYKGKIVDDYIYGLLKKDFR